MPITQENRTLRVTTPLGQDVVVLRRMTGTERLGGLFEFQLDLLSEDPEINLDDLLGQSVTVALDLEDGATRYFNGMVAACAQVEDDSGFACYRAILRPWLWFLSRRADCKVFQEMTVLEIIEQVFRDAGFTDFRGSLSGSYRTWDYLAQYRETDFNFVSRLMELEGLYYYFEHADGNHTLVVADDYASHAVFSGYEEVPYFPPQANAQRERDHLSQWALSRQVQTTDYKINEYNFTTPQADLLVAQTVERSHAQSGCEVYDYPGQYPVADEGTPYVQARIQELQAQYEVAEGRGNARGLAPGSLFSLTDYPRDDQNREYLIVSARYELNSDEFGSGSSATAGELCSCSITAIDSQTPYRSPRTTPKPVVQGPQTAVVVGPSGEEIYTDEYGRVKVQFHWDRVGQSDENSSCWIRVGQMWAGKTWGGIQIPRIGHEVIVEFLEGDPDRPIITGSVYNADNMPPYTLPDNMTQSGMKSRSTKEGDGTTFNELRFEDKKDEEQVYFHAEKDFERVVENNDTLKVGLDKKDPGDQTIEIQNNQTLTIGNSESDDGSQTTTIYKDRTTTLETGNDELTISQGDQTIKLDAGKVEYEAATSIELKVGESSILIEPAKITIKSVEIAIEADASVGVSGAEVTVEGSATLTLKGGTVLIN